MAIKLDAADTHTVIVALEIYAAEEHLAGNQWKVDQINLLLKQYRRSFKALCRLGPLR